MRRTNIYLPDDHLETLRALAEQRGEPVAELVRQAVSEWLSAQGVRIVSEDEWASRFEILLARRRAVAEEHDWTDDEIERDVSAAVAEVRRARRSRRR